MTLHYTKAAVEVLANSKYPLRIDQRWAEDWLALHAEVTRLREALAQIATGKLAQDIDDGTLTAVRLCGIARAALRPEEP